VSPQQEPENKKKKNNNEMSSNMGSVYDPIISISIYSARLTTMLYAIEEF